MDNDEKLGIWICINVSNEIGVECYFNFGIRTMVATADPAAMQLPMKKPSHSIEDNAGSAT